MKYAEISQSAQQLMSMARTKTGIDIVDNEIEAPLAQLVKALNTEAKLSATGAQGLESRLLRVLCNRLRMQRDFKKHPQINAIKITQPVFITSGPRTGSTKLHKLLSESQDFRFLVCWQGQSLSLKTGNRDEDPAERIEDSEQENEFFNSHAPQAKLIHEYSSFEPEEDVLIYEHFLYAPYFCAFSYVPSYVQWYTEHRDVAAELTFLKNALKYLQWQFYKLKAERWLLKAPHYNGSEDAILKIFPDAKFLITHRNPIHVASSLPSLYANFFKAYSDVDWSDTVGPMALNGLIYLTQLHMSIRETNPKISFLDISYSQLTTDIEPVIKQVYQHLEMPVKNLSLQKMLDWNNSNTQHKLGVHKHALDDFSLDKELVDNSLKNYVDRFSRYF